MRADNLVWDYDFKRILLGAQYNEEEPIKNILLAKDSINYVDQKSDYYKYYRGHIENYQLIEDIFERFLKNKKNEKNDYKDTYKDIMNSFWTTYKSLLQIEYPEIFVPNGSLSSEIPLKVPIGNNLEVNRRYPPFDSKNYTEINVKYVEYYNSFFPKLKVCKGDTWIKFLMNNFNEFNKVHENSDLSNFAKLTHSIGNISLVPKGFNSGRGNFDYWDLALKSLKEFLSTFDSWEIFIENHYLEEYVDDDYEVISFWSNHDKAKPIPKSREEVVKFLLFVNSSIENRGKRILEKDINLINVISV